MKHDHNNRNIEVTHTSGVVDLVPMAAGNPECDRTPREGGSQFVGCNNPVDMVVLVMVLDTPGPKSTKGLVVDVPVEGVVLVPPKLDSAGAFSDDLVARG